MRKKRIPRQMKKKLEMLESHEYTPEAEICFRLDENEAILKQTFANCSDFSIRKVKLFDEVPCMLAYLAVLVDSNHLDENFLKPLMKQETVAFSEPTPYIELIKKRLVPIAEASILHNWKEVNQRIVKGEVVIFIESSRQVLSVSITKPRHREIDEPTSEAVIRGPRVGFIENLSINMTLVRQLLQTPRLKMEKMSLGTVTHRDLVITYIEGMASQNLIEEVKNRISKIDMDSVLGTGYIEEMISDKYYTPFPLVLTTQRPDTIAGSLIEGKVAIILDGTPVALITPSSFWHGFHSVEDYYMNFIFATMLRWLRYTFAFLAMTMPSIYIALTTFHQEMIPTSLALSIAAAREVVPFPVMAETLIMEVVFDALREAGVRLPRPVGQTISIVGALVIGQAAVQAGIISAPIIIVVALTGIASFLIPYPNTGQAISILRYPVMLATGTFGLYGLGAALLAILIHLVNLESFGLPYMSPLAPFNLTGLGDVLVRAPWRVLHKRQRHKMLKMELKKNDAT